MAKHWLSKSRFIKSIQCQKALYLGKHHSELKDEISEDQQALFSQGTSVGELATQLFPGGTDVTPESFYDFSPSIEKTKELLNQKDVIIYEAAFQFEGILCALDILVKKDGVIKAYEVKSSTEVKSVYLQDAGLQYYVMKACGYAPEDISIVHINNEYVRNGDINIYELFTIASIKDKVVAFQPEIPALLQTAKATLEGDDIPTIDIGPHCSSPYGCDFGGHCWDHVPDYSVFNISRLTSDKKFELYYDGILDFKDIPDDYRLNDNQLLQVESELTGKLTVNKEEINTFLDSLTYPLQFLDFETFQVPVPLFDNARPYQQLVFQYSLHIQEKPGAKLTHYEFLAEGNGTDPREELINQLIKDAKGTGHILVYNIGFERGRLNELKEIYPAKADDIQSIIDRLVDLMIPFQKKHYYAPDLKGSYSIKKVLPSLAPELSYSALEVSNGGMAMDIFKHMMQGTYNGDTESTRKALLEYCGLDTYAMVKIVEKLKEMVQS